MKEKGGKSVFSHIDQEILVEGRLSDKCKHSDGCAYVSKINLERNGRN